jgi:hypothetical protein
LRAVTAVVGVVGALLLSGCALTEPRPSTHTTPPETTGGHASQSPLVRQIAVARSSNRVFAMFPAHPGTKRCAIPEGGVHFEPLAGRCTTSARDSPTHAPARVVTFTETWSTCGRADDCVVARTLHHTWHVIEGLATLKPMLRVVATRQSGATAPQYYK